VATDEGPYFRKIKVVRGPLTWVGASEGLAKFADLSGNAFN